MSNDIHKQPLQAYSVGDSSWPMERCLVVFAFKGVDAKVLGSDHIEWENWLTLRAERRADLDHHLKSDASEAYIAPDLT
ncbi:hypothetical protein EDC56_1172 [Sinobacterium caligoides]|uniref:Uncharacterized protein n=1 Tax=Sinobacterium caligoides TaxID=933926 RepID=A0A3N2E0K1_9GAMM|nr:hypothetical protein [Sinobacterium caligoides]ROS05626.1 hypothetical protein EDC56_1172 [Sinobacterium caligoides]